MAAIIVTCVSSLSPAAAAADLHMRDGWVRTTVPGQPVAAAYLTLRSPASARLIALRSDVSNAVEIHQMSLTDGVMRMRRVENLQFSAGQEILLAPGGMHLMLIGLTADEATIAATAKDFNVFYAAQKKDAGGYYTVDHSNGIFVFDGSGRLRVFMGPNIWVDAMVHDLKLLLGDVSDQQRIRGSSNGSALAGGQT